MGELGNMDLMKWNNFSKVSGGFRGKTGIELFDSSIGLEVSFKNMSKTSSCANNCWGDTSLLEKPKVDI